MELGEQIAVEVVASEGKDCPFDHTNPDQPPTVKNNLDGNGQTLGGNMDPPQTTITYAANRGGAPKSIPYPKDVANDPLPITIDGYRYPLTCAAHHLIPAQESLKRSTALLNCMVGGKLYPTDIGYDVNGVENGVWLPGNYAVGGNGTGEWTSAPSVLPDVEGGPPPKLPPAPAAASGSSNLTGYRHDLGNRKGQYMLQATVKAGGQFHDRHVDYSKLVLNTLEELARLYNLKQGTAVAECGKCKEILEKRAKLGTPFRLAHTLNGVSEKYRTYLVGCRGHKLVYTSRWGKAAHSGGASSF